jgi:hypothetical protein
VDGYPNGSGKAEYLDGTIYIGDWKSGQKNGKGTIYLKVNGKVVGRQGIWENDVMQKEILAPPYKVITQRNLTRLRIFKQGEGNSVWFYPNSTGGVASLESIQLSGNSGKEVIFSPKYGYEDVNFPFLGSIKYMAWNKLRTAQFLILLEIEIYQPGNWVVEIQN